MLWGVERAIAGLSAIGADTDVAHKLHVILPGSPNRGIFGGDGAYGEVKSAFRAEKVWSSHVTFAHPKIGWVRGTGLMGGNDPLVEVVERHGLKTYSTAEIAVKLLELADKSAREQAVKAPLDVDLTGGLGSEPIDIKALRGPRPRRRRTSRPNRSPRSRPCRRRMCLVRPRSTWTIGRA